MRYQKKERLKKCLKKIGILGLMKRIYRAHYLLRHMRYNWGKKKRASGYIDKKYKKLLKYHNIHKGERCFIVATGPSLAIADLEKLKKEFTFSMHSIVKLFDKTDWRPTYYVIQDSNSYQSLRGDKHFCEFRNKIISDNVAEEHSVEDDCVLYPLDLLDHMSYKAKKFNTMFSDNAYCVVYDGATVTYSIMQIAYYMGFKEIYLLGCDCDYQQEKTHFTDNVFYSNDNPESRMMYAYTIANEFSKSHNFKIYNATRGGKLEIFERRTLEDVL